MDESIGGTIPVVILGAGIGGLACVLALRQQGIASTVFERAPELREIGAGLLLTPNACAVLARLDVLSSLAGRSQVTPLWEVRSSQGRLLQHIRPFPTGGVALSARRSLLQAVLLQALPPGMVHAGHEAVALEVSPDSVRVSFGNGRRISASLVIGADGAGSLARQSLWPKRVLRDQGYVGWRALVPGVPPGWEDGRVTESWGRGERFGIAAVGGGATYWYASANLPSAREDDPGRRRESLLMRFGRWHAPIGDLIGATRNEDIYRHSISDARPSWRYTFGDRVALLGDAAHPLTPNLGQGAPMAIEDAWELATSLGRAASPAAALRRYERRRRLRVALVWALSHGMGYVVQADGRAFTVLRDAGLALMPDGLASAALRALYTYRPEGGTQL